MHDKQRNILSIQHTKKFHQATSSNTHTLTQVFPAIQFTVAQHFTFKIIVPYCPLSTTRLVIFCFYDYVHTLHVSTVTLQLFTLQLSGIYILISFFFLLEPEYFHSAGNPTLWKKFTIIFDKIQAKSWSGLRKYPDVLVSANSNCIFFTVNSIYKILSITTLLRVLRTSFIF